MRRFILRLAAFSGIALSCCVVLFVSVVLLNQRAIDNCRLKPGTESVIIGDSHTAWAIDDSMIPGVQNISHNAEAYKYTYGVLKHLLEKDPAIRRVYLGFSYHNLSAYYDDYIVGPTFRQFIDRFRSILAFGDYFDLVKRDPSGVLDIFMRTVRGGFSAPLKGGCPMLGSFSQERMTATYDSSVMEKRIREQYFVGDGVQGVSELNRQYLEKTIDLVVESGAELVIVNTPMHPDYRRRVPRKFVELYENILREHGLRAIDLADLPLTDQEFLPDGDHVNHAGAMRTSARMAELHLALDVGP